MIYSFPQVPDMDPRIRDLPDVPDMDPKIAMLLKIIPPITDPETMTELQNLYPTSSNPESLLALTNAPTVPQKILQFKNFIDNWVSYSKKQKQAIEQFIYNQALKYNQQAMALSNKSKQEMIKRQKGLKSYTEKQKQAIQTFMYNEALKQHQQALAISNKSKQEMIPSKKRKASEELFSGRKGKAPLRIDTNVRKVKGSRAPTTETMPEIDKSNVSATNIISQKRTRRKK